MRRWRTTLVVLALLATLLFYGHGLAPVAETWFWLLLALNLLTLLIYGLDKRAARRGGWRTPENTLHLLALFGGWPAALLAQPLFCHKTRKRRFRLLFLASMAANVILLAWLHSTDGLPLLRQLDSLLAS